MSDESSPSFTANAAEYGAEGLSTDAIDAILADFRAWLLEAKDALPSDAAVPFDVATVLQHFIALRQEINLQTKSNRTQLEQSAQTIAMLQEALGALERQQTQSEENDQNVQDEIVRPLLKTLVDTYDALSIAERQVRRLLDAPPPANAGGSLSPASAPPIIKLKVPHWARWLGLDASIEAQLAPLYEWHKANPFIAPVSAEASDRYRQSIEALLTGYRMSLQRIDRAFESYSVETFPCVGEAFDPELMEVAEVVRDESVARIEVIEELRRGYLWRGRLFRCAQVRVAKNS
jgi:molecular chaperone GrpE